MEGSSSNGSSLIRMVFKRRTGDDNEAKLPPAPLPIENAKSPFGRLICVTSARTGPNPACVTANSESTSTYQSGSSSGGLIVTFGGSVETNPLPPRSTSMPTISYSSSATAVATRRTETISSSLLVVIRASPMTVSRCPRSLRLVLGFLGGAIVTFGGFLPYPQPGSNTMIEST